MTTAAALLLLARANARMLRQRVGHMLQANRLLLATLASFLGLYGVATFALMTRGLDFLQGMPLFGPLLLERLVHLLFFCFFLMLVVSNATLTGMGLFRRQEMEWLVALPLPARGLVLWKTLEGMALASWGLLLLSAPILLALGRLYQAGPAFHLLGLPALLSLVTIAANLSTWLLLALVRHARRWWLAPLGLAAGALVFAVLLDFVSPPDHGHAPQGELLSSLHALFRHSELSMHPLLPSTWVAEVLLAAGQGHWERALFFNAVLLANALFALTLTSGIGAAWFQPAWHRVMTATPRTRRTAGLWYQRPGPPPRGRRAWGQQQALRAILRKDLLTFRRDPAQWGQSLLVFGLLLLYTGNLRNLGYDLQSPFWVAVISHLNLLVCCLCLSTLTTRFVFPQFSLEGQRLWILSLAPLPLERLLALKLRLSAAVMGLLAAGLVLISCRALGQPWPRVGFFVSAAILLSTGLNAIALGLGVLMPNFRQTDPSRIISGFGGTLCLIVSFLYLLLGSSLLALAEVWRWRAGSVSGPPFSPVEHGGLADLTALAGLLLLTLLFGGLPYGRAKKRTKSLDYLKEL